MVRVNAPVKQKKTNIDGNIGNGIEKDATKKLHSTSKKDLSDKDCITYKEELR